MNLISKFCFLISLSFLVFIYHDLRILWIVIAHMIFILCISSEIRRKFTGLINRLKYVMISLLIMQLLFRHEGELLYGFYFIKIYDSALIYTFTAFIRLSYCLFTAVILMDTGGAEFLTAMQTMRFPKELSLSIMLTFDYMKAFTYRFKHIRQLLSNRGFDFRTMTLKKKILVFQEIVFPVIASAVQEVKNKAIAIELAGFGLRKQMLMMEKQSFKRQDYALQIYSVLLQVSALLMTFYCK